MSYHDLYFKIVREVLDKSIEAYARTKGLPVSNIDAQISDHIQATSSEHQNPDPNIDYNDPLCRLGYLFTHVGANATLFEKTIIKSSSLSSFISGKSDQKVALCTVGGGPGTELLGLTKYLLVSEIVPSEVAFTVLDRVPEWGESWEFLADASQNLLKNSLGKCPVIQRGFYPMDAVNPQSYTDYAWLFERVDIIIFNYLISENKVRLNEFEQTLSLMTQKVKEGCIFVVIDRLERQTSFREDMTELFKRSDLETLDELKISGVMDDNESALGDYPERFNWRPRRWFRTRQAHHPTVFALVAKKPDDVDKIPF
jgi:hypothetical protein